MNVYVVQSVIGNQEGRSFIAHYVYKHYKISEHSKHLEFFRSLFGRAAHRQVVRTDP